jgi:LysR family hydrogen peroxide-inducible transcriptional activator
MMEVSIITHRDHVKKNLIEILKKEIITSLPEKVIKNKSSMVVPI